ncbi:MAG: nucleotidyltransferase family protein [Ignavibacteriales bacterium]|nr:nucleotidyltransferase family protein [Ignavibacteriales bacterium]
MSKPIINGLLISAGLSGRMGQFKPLMLYKDKSFVVTIVEKLLTVCERVVVVTGFKSDEVKSVCSLQFADRVECVFNPDYECGMLTSLQAGLAKLKDSDWIIYHFVDQPFHEEKFYCELISKIDDNYDWIQPCYNGKEGHPVLFKKNIFEKILTADSSSSLRLIRDDGNTKTKKWECGYSQILKDFDTPEDMQNFFLPNLF